MCVWLIPFLRDNTETVVLPISVVSTLALSYPFPGKAFLLSQIEIARYPFGDWIWRSWSLQPVLELLLRLYFSPMLLSADPGAPSS